MIKPRPDQAIRVSYNRAYRSPSVINNFLDLVIAQPIDLGLFSPALAGRIYPLPVSVQGNTDLKEQSLDAFEIGYTGSVFKRATLSAAYYVNNLKNDILFTQDHSVVYTAQNPPPGWPLPPAAIAAVPGGSLPARFTYLNFGRSVQRGLELGVNGPVNRAVNAFVNYSWQGTPDPKDFDLSELNIPPKNRFNAGFNFSHKRVLGDLSVNYSGSAFWQDVLGDRVPWHDRGLHDDQWRRRRALGGRQGDDLGEGGQPRQSGRAAARVRRHREAAGGRGDARAVLRRVGG